MQAKQVLFTLLRQEICGKKADMTDEAFKNEEVLADVFGISERHDLAHLMGKALERAGLLDSGDISINFRRQILSAIYRYMQQNHAYEQICKTLQKHKIPFIPLKGAVLRQFYPEPWMRTSCDIDILVRPADLDMAEEAIREELNYRKENKSGHDVSLYSPEKVHFELHYNLLEARHNEKSSRILQKVWNAAEPEDGYQFRMTDEMFYFHHIAHMAKHFVNGGCGIRTLLDLWILNHNMPFDREKRDALLAKGGLLTFEKTVRKLSECWFSGAPIDENMQRVETFVLQGGRYGGTSNMVVMRQARRGGKFKFLLHRLFPPYDVMKFYFPVLQKHKYLLPVFQILRWLCRIFQGGLKRFSREVRLNAEMTPEEQTNAKWLLEELEL